MQFYTPTQFFIIVSLNDKFRKGYSAFWGIVPEIVREIFKLFLSGWGYGRIATYLNSKKIPPPAQRLTKAGRGKFGIWCNGTIKSILTNPKYGGVLMQQRWKKISYKVKEIRPTREEQWVNSGEFQGIIPKEIFKEVQEIIERRGKGYRYKGNASHSYTSVLKCNECGGSMAYRNKYKGYKCTNSQRGGGRCTAHSIKEEFLNEVLLTTLKRYINEYIDLDRICVTLGDEKRSRDHKNDELNVIIKELHKLDRMFQKVYEDQFNDLINERNYETILRSIEKKQLALMERKEELEDSNKASERGDDYCDIYKEEINKLINLQRFPGATIINFIDKIIVTEDIRDKTKKVDVYYKFKNNISPLTNDL